MSYLPVELRDTRLAISEKKIQTWNFDIEGQLWMLERKKHA